MACRVGMSTTPWTRIAHWKEEEGHTHGEVLRSGLTYDRALALEAEEATKRGCTYAPGGERNDKNDWSVYHVWGGTIK